MSLRTAMLLCFAALGAGATASAAVRVIAVPEASAVRGIELRVGDVLHAPADQPELDVWRMLVLETDDATRAAVTLLRDRDGQRQPVSLPPGNWDLNVLPTTIAWSAQAGIGTENPQASASDRAAAWLAQARRQARSRQFDAAAVSFEHARSEASQFAVWIDLVQAMAFENHPDRSQPLQAIERAVAAQRAQPRSAALLATSLNILGGWRLQKRDHDTVERGTDEVLRLLPDTLIGAQAHVLRALLAMRTGAGDVAEEQLRRADLIVQRIAPQGVEAVQIMARRATLLAVKRQGDVAGAAYAEALQRLRALVPGSMLLGRVSFNAHLHAMERRRYAEAEAYARDSLQAFAAAAPDSVEHAQARSALADVLMQRGQFAEADALFAQALNASEALDAYSYESLSLRLQVGDSMLRQGRIGQALQEFDRLVAALATGPAAPLRAGSNLGADAQLYRAQALAELDRCAEAIAAATLAQQMSAQRTLAGAHTFDIELVISDCQRRLGRLDVAEAHARQALTGLIAMHADGLQPAQAHFALARVQRDRAEVDAALASYLQAIDEFEKHRERVGGSAQIRTLWASQFQAFYKEPLLLLAQLDRASEAADLDRRYRMQALLKLLGEADTELSREWVARIPQRALTAQLRRDQALISFVVAETHCVVLIDLPGWAVQIKVLPITRAQLRADIDRLMLLSSRVTGDPRSAATRDQIAKRLYDDLIAPLGKDIGGYANWIVVGDGPLLSLPWAGLVVDNVGVDATRYLVEDRIITTTPSAAVWALLNSYESRSDSVLAFADPELTQTVGVATRSFGSGALPGARGEADTVLALYPGRAERFVGDAVSEARVRALAPAAGMLHFALHSVVDAHEPMASHIVLASTDASEARDDGRLRADEIARDLKLGADLVVLSSCASARGGDGGGEGLMGLTSALHLAGARAVIGTRWPIADTPTSALMRDLHQGLRTGADSAQALAIAQRQWLQRARDHSWTSAVARRLGLQETLPESAESAFYWAGFVHSGASAATD